MKANIGFGLAIVVGALMPVTADAQFWPGYGQTNVTQADFGVQNPAWAPGFNSGWRVSPWANRNAAGVAPTRAATSRADNYQYAPGWAELSGMGNLAWGSGTGLGNTGWGVGTGEGMIWRGLGDFNYGSAAGVGRYWSGLGDYWWGRGEYLRGQGSYEKDSSQAAINRQEARYRDITNDDYYAQTYFNMRQRNDQIRASARRAAPSADDLERYSKMRAPKRLESYEYDPSLRTVFWPAVLQGEQFSGERANLDWLFSSRTPGNSGLGTPSYREIRSATSELRDKLKAQMNELEPMEYVAGRQFLDKLDFEARQRAGLHGLAMSH